MTRYMLSGAVLALGLTAGVAQAESTAGAQEFVQACASCHGITGQGDGAVAEYMTVTVPDLTQISARNDGVFPMLEVIHIIDGRTGMRGHGTNMPVWGNRFEDETTLFAGDYRPELAELLVRGRILALAEHLEAIQE